MKVRVRKCDIEAGRTRANNQCGCPIHHALGRTLKVRINPEIIDDNALIVRGFQQARLGRIHIPLPPEAVVFQKALVKDPFAAVKPFTFETELIAPK